MLAKFGGTKILTWLKKIHYDFLRKITLARKSTPLYMLYGELGRFPLQIIIKSRVIGYWNRLLQSKATKLSYVIYQCQLNTANIFPKWINYIQAILNQIGRPDIWLIQHRLQYKSLAQLTKKILIDQFVQDWHAKDTQSHKALIYFSFKHKFELEKYFITLPRKLYLQFFKLRTANHKLPIETGRWDGTEIDKRICPLCDLNDIGDEYHYICKCPYFDAERIRFIKPFFTNRPSMFKVGTLLGSTNESEMKKVCQFARVIFFKFR